MLQSLPIFEKVINFVLILQQQCNILAKVIVKFEIYRHKSRKKNRKKDAIFKFDFINTQISARHHGLTIVCGCVCREAIVLLNAVTVWHYVNSKK